MAGMLAILAIAFSMSADAFAAALGTSIDALVVGVTLALLKADIVVIALAIGAATFLMATAGVALGRAAGARLGRVAEAAGGLVLIAVGTTILFQHLGVAAAAN